MQPVKISTPAGYAPPNPPSSWSEDLAILTYEPSTLTTWYSVDFRYELNNEAPHGRTGS